MSRHSLSLVERRILVILLAAGLFCVATALSSRAAISAPQKSSDADAQFQTDSLLAQQSEWRRIETGKIRYQKKLERRASLVAGLHAELEKRQASISLQPMEPQNGADETAGAVTMGTFWGLLAIGGLLLFRHSWIRAAVKEKPKSYEPVKPLAGVGVAAAKTRELKPVVKPAVKAPVKPAAVQPARRPVGMDVNVIDLDHSPLKPIR